MNQQKKGIGLRASRNFHHGELVTGFGILEDADGRQVVYETAAEAQTEIQNFWGLLYEKPLYVVQECGAGRKAYIMLPALMD